MQRVNFHRPPVAESSGLTFPRFLIVALGSVVLALAMLAINFFSRNQLQQQLSIVGVEIVESEKQLQDLRSRPAPATDPALTAQLTRMQSRYDYWLSVLDLLKSSDSVSMARLDDALIALDRADTDGVWLEQISINYRANPVGRLQGRAIHSDASADYLRRLEGQLNSTGLTVTEMTVTAQQAEPLQFRATLQTVGKQ